MSTAQLFQIYDSTTVANFNATMSAISTQLNATGFTKTSDTGQVNWSTNASVPGNNSWTLYEIRQPASDPLQTGSTKYYIRIEYGQRGSAPCFRVTLGTGTDGAGNLTGFQTIANFFFSHYNGGGTNTGNVVTWECDYCWTSSSLSMLLWRNHRDNGSTCLFSIERTKNTAGADNSDGVTLIVNNQNQVNNANAAVQQTLVFAFGATPSVGFNQLAAIWANPSAGAGSSMNFNLHIPVTPIFPCYGKWANPLLNVLAIFYTDAVEGSFLQTEVYGATHTYIMFKAMSVTGQSNQALMMRYE